MQLFYNSASPFARKTLVVLHEVGLTDKVTLTHTAGHPLASADMPVAHNPLGKLPTLARDDAPAIYDSRVICQFLNDLGGGTLYPEAGKWELLTLEATADGIMDAAVLMVYEARCRPEQIRFDDWVEAQWDKITRSLNVIENLWMSHLAGPIDASHIAVGCALGYLDLRHGARDWRATHPKLAAWYAGFEQRPSMQATKP